MNIITLAQMGKPVDVSTEHRIRFGALDVRLEKDGGEWHLVSQRMPSEDEHQADDPDGTGGKPTTIRWVANEPDTHVHVLPLMPDRPVVVRPEYPVNLPGHMSMTLFVGIPLWLGIEADGVRLLDAPSVSLSNTWFGTPVEGSLCYAMRTRALRRPEQFARRPHRAICPVDIHNDATAPLAFARLCIPCQHLSLFRGSDRLWSNGIRLNYHGDDEWSRIAYTAAPPTEADATEALAPPRQPLTHGLLARYLARD